MSQNRAGNSVDLTGVNGGDQAIRRDAQIKNGKAMKRNQSINAGSRSPCTAGMCRFGGGGGDCGCSFLGGAVTELGGWEILSFGGYDRLRGSFFRVGEPEWSLVEVVVVRLERGPKEGDLDYPESPVFLFPWSRHTG